MTTTTEKIDEKEAYEDKLTAEFKIWNAKLSELREKEKKSDATARIEYLKQIEEMEGWVGNLRSRIKNVGEKTENTWKQFKKETDDFMQRMENKFRR